MKDPTLEEMQEFSARLNELINNEKYVEAKKMLSEEFEIYPEEYFLVSMLSEVSLYLHEYSAALSYSEEAVRLCDTDFLVIFNYAWALVSNKKYREALKWCNKINSTRASVIAMDSEGARWARALKYDASYLTAVCHFHTGEKEKAVKELYFLLKKNLFKGCCPHFKKEEIEKTIEEFKKKM